MALSARPVYESQLCSESTTQRDCGMVLREQRINRMESEGIALVDSWQTYVFRILNECVDNNILVIKRGQEKAHSCMS